MEKLSRKRTKPDDSSDEDDLLKHLDVAYRRERWKERKRRSRQHHEARRQGEPIQLLQPVSSEEQNRCMAYLREELGAEGLDESACGVCDCLVLARDLERIEGSDWRFMDKLRDVLGVFSSDLPRLLVDQYRAPPHIDGLEHVLVSPRGFHCYVDENGYPGAWMGVCNNCMRSIRRRLLPKFAIANGFFVGSLPKRFKRLTIPERFITQLASMAAITRVMRGGRHRCIRSHCLAFDCTPGAPISLLPRSIENVSSYRVVLVGDFTEGQVAKVKKMHRIRNKVAKGVFNFYMAYNHLYSGVEPCEDVLNMEYQDEVIDRHFIERVRDSAGYFDDGISTEGESVRGQSDSWQVNDDDEDIILERRVGLMDDSLPVLASEHPFVTELGDGVSKERDFMVRRSSQLSNDVNGDLLARLFPHLFPFGRGHPGESRRVAVSAKESIKHYIKLSERQFAEDELFTLVAFDRVSLQNMYIQNSVRCKRFPNLYEGFESIGVDQLGEALLANERRRQGFMPRRRQVDRTADRFIKTVELASIPVWGSNAERSQCRQKAFAYQARFGQPALFITLTPNSDNSFAMAQYTGIGSVETLFDVLEARMPSKAELREAALGNDAASARLFMRQVDAFIKVCIAIDPASKTPLHRRGLFGDAEAYFGMVETQGRGTLHIHFLIWLRHCPPNSAATEELLQSSKADGFCKSVEAYVASIVSNTLPLSLESQRCSGCGATTASMVALPIPDSARKDPCNGLYSALAKRAVTEPALLQCKICNMKYSSQHFLRSLLLQHRPLHWPKWNRSLSASELEKQATQEMKCRGTFQQAINVVSEREAVQASLADEHDLRDEAGLTPMDITECLEHQNCVQMVKCTSDNDPFQNDYLTRLLEMLPPSKSDCRLPRMAVDYMVSTLVLLQNQHWWSHTNTCFKKSRATSDDSFCRYSFPRDRVLDTTFSSSGVQTRRSLGHEYVNGFNYTIMATFKCNHDIQFLLGGEEITHRIHYCCKYVTKQQNRLDSVVAIALGALKRRQEREQEESMAEPLAALDRLTIARKRVASVVYSMTNRQEVAGPLAALYLFRGSCCYSSAACSTLPLGDIVRQLCTSGEYSCNLVRQCNQFGASSFQAVSYLDDYIFRPSALIGLSLYEFAMRYFRKKSEHDDETYQFLSGHRLHRSHSLGQRFQEVVPVIRGYRLPYTDSESTVEFQCKYAILSLVLFKPFRSLADLVGVCALSDDAWLRAYDQWKNSRSIFIKTIMNNMNDYYTGRSHAKAQHANVDANASAIGRPEEEADGIKYRDDEDDLYGVGEEVANEHIVGCADANADHANLFGTDEDSSIVVESRSLNPAFCPSAAAPQRNITHILSAFESFCMLDGAARNTSANAIDRSLPRSIVARDLMRWIREASTDNAIVNPLPELSNQRDTEVVELLNDTLRESNMRWCSELTVRSQAPGRVSQFASISSISRAFTLNEKQHCALKKIGIALLTRWKNSESLAYLDGNLDDLLSADQLRFFLGGEGGTGKSRIIEAVETLCISWERSTSIVKTALTGKAATLIGGRTLESFLLQVGAEKAIGAIIDLDVLVIDEISMMKRSQLVQLDGRLRQAKRVPRVPFGGVHVILVGDFLQLPPVGAEPIFRDPALKPKSTAVDFTGYQLWRSFEEVIILDESVRFQDDPEWGRGCHDARLGIWTPQFVDLINSRVLEQHTQPLVDWFSGEAKTTFVTPDNSTRLSINNLFISTTAKILPEGTYPVRVVANFKGQLQGLNRAEVAMVMGLPDSKFGRMAPYLDLIVGMPIQVTQNIRPQKMVANGTLGTLESIIYERGTTFRVIHDSTTDVSVQIPSVPPLAVIVRLCRGKTAKPMLGEVDSDLFPLFFKCQAFKACDIALAGTCNACPRRLAVRIQQFPLVCAVASTIYKVQGETLDRMVVTEWRSKTTSANKREQPYLLVSRVTLTPDIISWAHPPADALAEEKRLQRLSDLTIGLMK